MQRKIARKSDARSRAVRHRSRAPARSDSLLARTSQLVGRLTASQVGNTWNPWFDREYTRLLVAMEAEAPHVWQALDKTILDALKPQAAWRGALAWARAHHLGDWAAAYALRRLFLEKFGGASRWTPLDDDVSPLDAVMSMYMDGKFARSRRPPTDRDLGRLVRCQMLGELFQHVARAELAMEGVHDNDRDSEGRFPQRLRHRGLEVARTVKRLQDLLGLPARRVQVGRPRGFRNVGCDR